MALDKMKIPKTTCAQTNNLIAPVENENAIPDGARSSLVLILHRFLISCT
jgi:hypothetical protein